MTDPPLRGAGRLDFRDLGIQPGAPRDCPYLEERSARERAFALADSPAGLYKHLMDYGWRRSGRVIYKPACEGCSACVPIRIPVAEFAPSRTQRRTMRSNADIVATVGRPASTDEKFGLFVRYQETRHAGDMCTQREQFERFLYDSPVATMEAEFRLGGDLVGVSIIDRDGEALSAVYTWFAPEFQARSLGTWAILWSIGFAKEQGVPYYYMGYYIEGCGKMNYKAMFRPYELCDGAGNWTRQTS